MGNFINKYIHIIISIFNLIAGIYAFREENFAVTMCVVIVISFIGFVYMVTREKKNILKITKDYHKFCHELRNLIMELYLNYEEEVRKEKSVELLESKFLSGIKKIVDMVATYFTSLLNIKISACVKTANIAEKDIFFKNKWVIKKDELYLHTMARSDNSHHDRVNVEIFPLEVPIKGNTSFEKIFEKKEPWYIGNDLKKMFDEVENTTKQTHIYTNLTDHFDKYYNSTIVVPIRYHLEEESYDVIAILAIDSEGKNTFKYGLKDQLLTYLLGAFADGIYLYARLFKTLESKMKGDDTLYGKTS